MPASLPKAIAITGPTASGKSALALQIARAFDAEIINADSRQVYKRLRIGTAKPEGAWHAHAETGEPVYHAEGVPHYLMDILDAQHPFTAAEWACAARQSIYEILSRGKRACIVGGTGLYLDALVYNFQMPPAHQSGNLRALLSAMPLPELAAMLKKTDPLSASAIDMHNPRRVARALEFTLSHHESFAKSRARGPALFDVLCIGVHMPREALVRRINARVDRMMESGWVNEAAQLMKEGIDPMCQAMQSVGYRELIAYLEGRMTLPEATERIKTATRRYAKRQMTWFKRNPSIHWVHGYADARSLIEKFYNAEVTSS